MSMEDARYSVIRYLASPIENAYGPNVHDPRSGEILESHICWYHNVMKLVHDWYMIQAGSIDEAAQKMKYDEELMGNLIRFVSSHEVGHTLGLRHNFGSSSTVPVDSLRSKAWVEKNGHTPSIMDYARFNYVAQPEDGISRVGIFPRIGDYDKWAIQWGYTPMFDAYDSESDHYELEKLVKENLNGNRRLWFGDGETNRYRDPRCRQGQPLRHPQPQTHDEAAAPVDLRRQRHLRQQPRRDVRPSQYAVPPLHVARVQVRGWHLYRL